MAGLTLDFTGGHQFSHAVHYLAWVNLKGVVISVGIGMAVYFLFIARAKGLRRADSKAGRRAVCKAQNEKVHRARGANSRHGVFTQVSANNHGIHHAVELLEKIAQQNGQ